MAFSTNEIHINYVDISKIKIQSIPKNFKNNRLLNLHIKRITNSNQKLLISSAFLKTYFIKNNLPNEGFLYCNKYGKWMVKNNLYFISITHAGNYCLFSYGKFNHGIDIEKIDKTFNFEKNSHLFLNNRELSLAKNNNYNSELCYRFWSIKESYWKMNRRVFFIDPDLFTNNHKFIKSKKSLIYNGVWNNYSYAFCMDAKHPNFYKFKFKNVTDDFANSLTF